VNFNLKQQSNKDEKLYAGCNTWFACQRPVIVWWRGPLCFILLFECENCLYSP